MIQTFATRIAELVYNAARRRFEAVVEFFAPELSAIKPVQPIGGRLGLFLWQAGRHRLDLSPIVLAASRRFDPACRHRRAAGDKRNDAERSGIRRIGIPSCLRARDTPGTSRMTRHHALAPQAKIPGEFSPGTAFRRRIVACDQRAAVQPL